MTIALVAVGYLALSCVAAYVMGRCGVDRDKAAAAAAFWPLLILLAPGALVTFAMITIVEWCWARGDDWR